jgi:serine/threonine protein kinase
MTKGPEPSDSSIRPGARISANGKYQLERPLGDGLFGSVWLARVVRAPDGSVAEGASVAIKFFKNVGDNRRVELVRRELSSLIALQNDRVPPVHDWLVEPRRAFIVMRFYPRGSLNDLLREQGPLDIGRAWRLLIDLLQALRAAHRAGLLHLDLKPSNVLLDDSNGFVLTDFSIAQTPHATGDAVTVGLGTAGYQAPEQWRQLPELFDTRTDLWGVGTTLWSAVSGIDLYVRRDLVDRRAAEGRVAAFVWTPGATAQLGERPGMAPSPLPRLATVRRDCPPALDAIVMALLRDDPDERPGGAAEVLAHVQVVIHGTDPAPTPSIADRLAATDQKAARAVLDELMDPLWESVFRGPAVRHRVVRFDADEYLAREGEISHFAMVLLRGRVAIEVGGQPVKTEYREGTFLGEVSTLTGTKRTASLRAETECWAAVLTAAELERFLVYHPTVALRLVKVMADRILAESNRRPAPPA